MNKFTHIRSGVPPYDCLCGADKEKGPTISEQHYKAQRTNPAIQGQLDRLPEPLCFWCVSNAVLR